MNSGRVDVFSMLWDDLAKSDDAWGEMTEEVPYDSWSA